MYNELRDHGQKGVVVQALSAVDNALWDIRGKHFGVPVHVLMGGPLRSQVPACVGAAPSSFLRACCRPSLAGGDGAHVAAHRQVRHGVLPQVR